MSDRRNPPLVSVVIPTYNCARYIGEAIESVLAQDFEGREIVVVDDGSTDSTREVLGSFGSDVRCIVQENRGAPAARNTGIRAARGQYIAFLDADDVWLPGKLRLQMEFLEGHPQVGLAFTDALWFDERRIIYPSWTAQRDRFTAGQDLPPGGTLIRGLYRELVLQNFITVSSGVFRRSAYAAVGPFEETYRTGEDHHYWLRLAARYPIGYIHAVLVKYRIRAGGLIQENFDRWYLNEIRLLREAATWPGHFQIVGRAEWRRRLAELHFRLGWRLLQAGRQREARGHVAQAIARWPWQPWPYAYLPFTFLPAGGVRALRSLKRALLPVT